ncbi:hypothetical protein GOV09_03730 [Candidatus Woesearchaeota archaeon]|nr:hypothetical protein [Candidatus Woesearchaeota archaeon]
MKRWKRFKNWLKKPSTKFWLIVALINAVVLALFVTLIVVFFKKFL